MQIRQDISYAPHHGVRGCLDLFLPEGMSGCPILMVIHGGGLQALNKERMTGVSTFIAEQGWAAVNINYRLLPDHPFPAALEDVLTAYRWIMDTDREDTPGGRFDYPSIIQAKDNTLHATYSYNLNTIKHAHFSEAWIIGGDHEI